MTPLTFCDLQKQSNGQAVVLGVLLRRVVFASYVAMLILAHIYIKFASSDYRYSARRLQEQREKAENEAAQWRIAALQLESRENIQTLARNLGMQPAQSPQIQEIKSFADLDRLRSLEAKYSTREWSRSEDAKPIVEKVSLERVVAGIADRIGDKAYAK